MAKVFFSLVITNIISLAKRSFPLPNHGNRKQITSQSIMKEHPHIKPKAPDRFDLQLFPLQQNHCFHIPVDGSFIPHEENLLTSLIWGYHSTPSFIKIIIIT